ncbi:MAG: GrpB family protein [Lachnospiraceae bacterium]|nr:GrpB family protein [Lachnospiraceae bacterium]
MKEAKEGPCMSIGMKRGTVYLEEHQKIWEDNAKQTICEIQDLLVGIGADVEHVGSTSIKSIKAKPIIDIAVGVEEYEEILSRNEQLQKAAIVFPICMGIGLVLLSRKKFA